MTGSKQVHEVYRKTDAQPANLLRCAVCGHTSTLWEFTETPLSPVFKVVTCGRVDAVGPQNPITSDGCPMGLPTDEHRKARVSEAVAFWNDLQIALVTVRAVSALSIFPRPHRSLRSLIHNTPAELFYAPVDWNDLWETRKALVLDCAGTGKMTAEDPWYFADHVISLYLKAENHITPNK